MKIIGNLRNKIRLHNAKKFIHIDKNLPEAEKKIIKDKQPKTKLPKLLAKTKSITFNKPPKK